jgi:hypothetical protein
MALSVNLSWDKAISLGTRKTFEKKCNAVIDDLPDDPGIYVFARKFGKALIPIYIGQASNGLRARLKQQFDSVKLMNAVKAEKTGGRVLLLGRVKLLKNQKLADVLNVAEKAHIEHALTAGYPLVNIKGTKTKRHSVLVAGPKAQNHPFPRLMYLAVKNG